jgi:trans-aconitate 2-methyltransferase
LTTGKRQDWNPETYAKFRGFRLRPAMDLLAQVPDLPAGEVVDLGCGNGPVGPALAQRFQGRRLIGVDHSPAM